MGISRSRLLLTVTWFLTIAEALTMGGAGTAKFMGDAWQSMFADWGFPSWLVTVTGLVEIGASILLLVPRLAIYAGATLVVVMLGALITELSAPRLGWHMPVIHLTLLGLIIALRIRLSRARPQAR